MYRRADYEADFVIHTLRPCHARPRHLAVGKPYKPRTKQAKRQYVPGYPPRPLAAYSWR